MDNNGAFTCSIAVNGGIPIADMGSHGLRGPRNGRSWLSDKASSLVVQ